MIRARHLAATLATVAAAALPAAAEAHSGGASAVGLVHGLMHPLLGWDHMLAAVAAGCWAGTAGGRARWAWPAAFVAAMLGGFALAATGAALPAVETMILASLFVFAIALALGLRPGALFGSTVVAGFAFFHGFAHGHALPHATTDFALGLAATTAGTIALSVFAAQALARLGTARAGRAIGVVLLGLGTALAALS